jgi:oxaloacetate decarboxylase gamma subunit
MHESLLGQGVDLLIFGVGTVFSFLVLLIVVISIISKIVVRFFPEAPAVAKPASRTPSTAAAIEPQVLAAIQGALKQHRARHT